MALMIPWQMERPTPMPIFFFVNIRCLSEIETSVIHIYIAKIPGRQAGLANNCSDQKAFNIISLIFQVTQM